jgi:hypothetical protein
VCVCVYVQLRECMLRMCMCMCMFVCGMGGVLADLDGITIEGRAVAAAAAGRFGVVRRGHRRRHRHRLRHWHGREDRGRLGRRRRGRGGDWVVGHTKHPYSAGWLAAQRIQQYHAFPHQRHHLRQVLSTGQRRNVCTYVYVSVCVYVHALY